MRPKNRYDANIYYISEDPKATVVRPKLDKDGKFIENYWKYEVGSLPTLAADYNSLRIEGAEGFVGEDGKTHQCIEYLSLNIKGVPFNERQIKRQA